MFSLSDDKIDQPQLLKSLSTLQSGGVVIFEGKVRDHNQGLKVSSLEYQVYEELALKEGAKIINEAYKKFNIHNIKAVHTYGHLQLGDTAVWIGVEAAHRDDAFKACRFIIDQIKLRLPIWKKEHYVDDQSKWVFCKDHHHHVHLCEHEYYSKQSTLVEQDILKKSKVLLIGVGGLGSGSLPALVSAGVGHIRIVDFDLVSASNLHRQVLYDVQSLGERKVDIAKFKMQALNPFITIEPIPKRIDENNYEELFSDIDFVLDCTDNLWTKMLIHDACHKLRIPFISSSIYKYFGKMRTFNPGHGCLRCDSAFENLSDEMLGNCNDVGVLGASVLSLGSLMAQEAIHFLQKNHNNSLEHTIFFDFESLSMTKFKNFKNHNCLTCKGDIKIDRQNFYLTHQEATLQGARFYHVDEFDLELLKNEYNKPIVLSCKRGIRAMALVKRLRSEGHESVFALKLE